MQEKKGSEKREVLLISFSISARFVFAIIEPLCILKCKIYFTPEYSNDRASEIFRECPIWSLRRILKTRFINRKAGASIAPAFSFYRRRNIYLLILAHESLRVTVRLNTGCPGLESVSAQKYPTRSNWNGCPMGASPSDGSR